MNKTDTLNRPPFVEQVVKLIDIISANKGNTTFAIDGKWGCGKSFVLDMLEERLNDIQDATIADNKYFVIKYNCWEYDFYDEPLIAFVAAIIDYIPHVINNEERRVKFLNIFKAFALGLCNIGNSFLKNKFGIDMQAALAPILKSAKKIKKKSKEQIQENHSYDNYFDFKKKLSELQDILSKISSEQTIIIIVDELDRCLPEYAIKVLERIHHITENLPNTITIVATDKTKLKNTVDKIYGFDVRTDTASIYLKKFINFEIELDNGINDENILEKFKTFIDQFKNFDTDKKILCNFITQLFNNIPSREQEHLWEQTELIHKLIADTQYDCSVLAAELLLVVYTNYYGYRIVDGIKTTELSIPLGVHPTEKNLSKFEQNYKNESFRSVKTDNYKTCLYVTKETGLYGKVLWYLNNIKPNTNPYEPCYIQLSNDVYQTETYRSNIAFLRNFSEALKLIK